MLALRVIVAVLVLAVTADRAMAGTVVVGDLTGSIASGTLGTVTLAQAGPDEVDVSVALVEGIKFVTTGKHVGFAFNLDTTVLQSSTLSFTLTGTDATDFSLVGSPPPYVGSNKPTSVSQPGYGTFTDGYDCTACGTGGKSPVDGPLDFMITDASGIGATDFIANASKFFFTADLIAVSTGKTGPAGVNKLTTTRIPEPAGSALFATALIGLATARRRR